MKAVYKGVVLAQATEIQTVEGTYYFPPQAIKRQYLSPSSTTTMCSWKGEANYHHVRVLGETLEDAAWYYPQPNEPAEHIRNWIAYARVKGISFEK